MSNHKLRNRPYSNLAMCISTIVLSLIILTAIVLGSILISGTNRMGALLTSIFSMGALLFSFGLVILFAAAKLIGIWIEQNKLKSKP